MKIKLLNSSMKNSYVLNLYSYIGVATLLFFFLTYVYIFNPLNNTPGIGIVWALLFIIAIQINIILQIICFILFCADIIVAHMQDKKINSKSDQKNSFFRLLFYFGIAVNAFIAISVLIFGFYYFIS